MPLSQNTFNEVIHHASWFHSGQRILVACSGGPDSIALLHLLKGEGSFDLHVAHIDHGLRGEESDRDAQFVADLAAELDLPFHLKKIDMNDRSNRLQMSIEEAGSITRRKLLNDIKQKYECEKICTAHHEDDLIETVIMNLFTGTGLKGLSGISPANDDYIRPLLSFSKQSVMEFLASNSYQYCIDRTNRSSDFLRNHIRNQFLYGFQEADIEGLRSKILLVAKNTRELLNTGLVSLQHIDNKGIRTSSVAKISLGMAGLADYFSPIKKMLFDSAFNTISRSNQGLSKAHHQALEELLPTGALATQRELPKGIRAIRDRNALVLLSSKEMNWDRIMTQDYPITIPGGIVIEFEEREQRSSIRSPRHFWVMAPEHAYFRRVRQGDMLCVNGEGRSLSVLQILQEAHVAPHIKEYFPVLVINDQIAWVPGVRTAHPFLVDVPAANELKHCMSASLEEGIFE